MELFNTVFQSVVALLGIGIIGFWIIKRGILPESVLGFLSTLAVDIALPSIVFANVITKFSPRDYPGWWQLPLWWFGFAAVTLVLTLILMFLSRKSTRSEFAIGLFYQNGIFFPLIVMSGIFGSGTPYISQLFIFIVLHPVMYFSTYRFFFRNRAAQEVTETKRFNLRRIFNAVLFATILAMVIRLAGIERFIPEFFVSIFQMLGGMTLPLLMIILGGSLYLDFQQKGKIYWGEMVKFVLVKNVIFPLAILGLLILIKPSYNIAVIMLLEAAVPPLTGIPLAAKRSGGNGSIANQFVLSSFVFSIVSVPSVFLLFSHFFPMP